MRRHVLHISAASLALTVSFHTVGDMDNLISALLLTMCVYVLARIIPEMHFNLPSDFDSHQLKVAAVTLILWIPVLAVFLPLLIPQSGLSNCTDDLP